MEVEEERTVRGVTFTFYFEMNEQKEQLLPAGTIVWGTES